ncbi:hypothetical protein [Pseudomonas sp. PLMAX]|uniref:hypothetical protein n=1 Tax=Pseudomonas sp. PLMAX TaxID=2201998 RepID=UPI0038BCB5A6
MINSSLIHIDEVFTWADDFTKVTGLTTYAALQVYAECCYFQDPNALLERLISIEAEYKLQLEESETDEDDEPDIDGEIWSEHYGKYQLILESIGEEDAKKFAEHYEKILVHHGFNKQFSVYFIDHFHPLSEYVTSNAPPVDKRFLFQNQYSYEPYFTEPPEAPEYRWHEIMERLEREPSIDPTGWIAVFKMLGYRGMHGNSDPCWSDYEPSFYLGPSVAEAKKISEEEGFDFDENEEDFWGIYEQTPVFIAPITITEPNTFSWDMFELRHELKKACDTAIVLYAAPYILRAPDSKSFISVWGEILEGENWKVMPLHANSISLETILNNSFEESSGPDWQNATFDQPLVEIWQKHHVTLNGLSASANTSEVIGFKPGR